MIETYDARTGETFEEWVTAKLKARDSYIDVLEAETAKLRNQIRERDELLRKFVDKELAGICCDDVVDRCLYCDWVSEDPTTEPQHEADCPIVRARAVTETK